MRDFFNSIGNNISNNLHNLDKTFHNKIKDSFIDDFIHELRNKLWEFDNLHKLNSLPKDTTFRITDSDTDSILCRRLDTTDTDERFYIPYTLFPKEIREEVYDRRDCYVRLGEDNFYHLYSKEDNTLMY